MDYDFLAFIKYFDPKVNLFSSYHITETCFVEIHLIYLLPSNAALFRVGLL